MSAQAVRTPRRIKVRGGNLGPFLCWAVVFADIGTSIYYVPGILYQQGYTTRSSLFVLMTLFVFILLTFKYAEVAWRYPGGGGVVTVASRALHPVVGLIGGLFISVDYYLTAALSGLSGVLYLAVLAPGLAPVAAPATVIALCALAVLNWFGIKESARASAIFAALAALGQLVVVGAVAWSLGPAGIAHSISLVGRGPALTPGRVVTGYAAAFLAFSGLESIAQVAPAMREPRARTARRAMLLVILTMAVTSPLLTLWSTTLLPSSANPNQFISLLGQQVSGRALGDYVAVSGALLLIFAANTAIIGSYHVFIAMARMGFLPRVIEHRNRWRRTPHWAILTAVIVPVAVILVVGANSTLLGDLYAFGLLGAFVLTGLGVDVVRWREGQRSLWFFIGVLTTALVLLAWAVNLVAKPLATAFGGGLTVLGLLIGLATWNWSKRHRPSVFPVPYHPERAAESIAAALAGYPAELLVVIPHGVDEQESVLAAALHAAAGRRILFLYRGTPPQGPHPELLEVADPYLRDYSAQDAFSRIEAASRRKSGPRRYVYVPGNLRPDVVGRIWRLVEPRETVVLDGDQALIPAVALDRVRRHVVDGVSVLHMISGRPSHLGLVPA